jgi:hypothetical protein
MTQPSAPLLRLFTGVRGRFLLRTSPRRVLGDSCTLEPTFDGRVGDHEEVLNLLSRYAAVYCGKRLQSEVPRISVHGGHSRAGSLLMQTAVRSAQDPKFALTFQGVRSAMALQVSPILYR